MTIEVQSEATGEKCGFDYRSFIGGFDCSASAIDVLVDGEGFHLAHLCRRHATEVAAIIHTYDTSADGHSSATPSA